MEKKIEEIKEILREGENDSFKGAKQLNVVYSKFFFEKMQELKEALRDYGVMGKRQILATAVLYLLSEIKKDKENGKKS